MDNPVLSSAEASSMALNDTITSSATNAGGLHYFGFLYGWLSFLIPLINSSPWIQDSLRFFLLGSVLETGRRLFQWTMDRFTSGFFVTAHFQQVMLATFHLSHV